MTHKELFTASEETTSNADLWNLVAEDLNQKLGLRLKWRSARDKFWDLYRQYKRIVNYREFPQGKEAPKIPDYWDFMSNCFHTWEDEFEEKEDEENEGRMETADEANGSTEQEDESVNSESFQHSTLSVYGISSRFAEDDVSDFSGDEPLEEEYETREGFDGPSQSFTSPKMNTQQATDISSTGAGASSFTIPSTSTASFPELSIGSELLQVLQGLVKCQSVNANAVAEMAKCQAESNKISDCIAKGLKEISEALNNMAEGQKLLAKAVIKAMSNEE